MKGEESITKRKGANGGRIFGFGNGIERESPGLSNTRSILDAGQETGFCQ